MSKIQDGNGSSKDAEYADFQRAPQSKADVTTPEDEDPKSKGGARDALNDFKNSKDFPVNLNEADVHRLINEYLAKMSKGLRT